MGVPVLHDRVTYSTFWFVVDKVRRKLHNWEAKKLSTTGGISLAQSVLLAIPNFFLQTMMIPKEVCAEIEKIVRQFIWSRGNGCSKMALVRWESICQPRSRGGLGLQHIHDQNSSFLMKLGFHLTSNSDAFVG